MRGPPAVACACHPRSPRAGRALGKNQSPVNIDDPGGTKIPIDDDAPQFGGTDSLHRELTFTLKNTTGGRWCTKCDEFVDQRWGALKAVPPNSSGPAITFNGAPYILREFHFHLPAEHLVDHDLAVMEMHFVFQSNKEKPGCGVNEYVVIGRRFKLAEAKNPEIEKIVGLGDKLPRKYSDRTVDVKDIVIANFLTEFPYTLSYRYAGSLTAPAPVEGCTSQQGNPEDQLKTGKMPEVVAWAVETSVGTISPAQLATLRSIFPNGDARAPQALNQPMKKGRDRKGK